MDINKIIGYILLLAGLLLIVVPLYQTYTIFTGKGVPPQVFKTQTVTPPATQSNNPFDIQQQMQKALISILPIELINNTLNLTSWIILLWILMFGGGQIANIGIKLLKIPREES